MKKKISVFIAGILSISLFTGCALLDNEIGKMKSAFKGRDAYIQSYDEESNIIDKIEGTSIDISADDKFAKKDSEGNTTKESSVLSLTVGGKSMTHVGSSLILYEKGLVDEFEKFSKTVDIKNFDRSVPILNRIVNNVENITIGQSKIILIRSQSGKPLATFVGESVSYFSTGIDKSTGIMIDGKYLFIYRCDYTIYEADLF